MTLLELVVLAAGCLVVAALLVALVVRVMTARARARRAWPPARTTAPQTRLQRPRLDAATARRRLHDPDATQQLPRITSPPWPDIDPDRPLPTDPDHPHGRHRR